MKIKSPGVRKKKLAVTGKKTQTRMIRVHLDFANYLVAVAEEQSKQQGRTVTVVEITQTIFKRLST